MTVEQILEASVAERRLKGLKANADLNAERIKAQLSRKTAAKIQQSRSNIKPR